MTVSVAGAKAKKTTFTYKDEPRRTTVSPEGEPATIYDIAPDGSVLKSWNTQVPPEIENLSGSLYANKETAEAITPGDYELLVQAFSAEGIASIQIIANGDKYRWPGEPDTPHIEEQEFPRYERQLKATSSALEIPS